MSTAVTKPTKTQRFIDLARELRLTDKMKTYADARVATGNKTEAGRIAKLGKHPEVQAWKMEKLPKVAAYIAELEREMIGIAERRLGRKLMERAEVLERLSEHADFDAADFITIVPPDPPKPTVEGQEPEKPKRPDWYIDIPKAIEAGKGHLIQEIGFDAHGLPKLKFPDRQGALDKLAKFHKMYDTNEAPVTVNVTLQQVLQRDPVLAVEIAKRLLAGDGTR